MAKITPIPGVKPIICNLIRQNADDLAKRAAALHATATKMRQDFPGDPTVAAFAYMLDNGGTLCDAQAQGLQDFANAVGCPRVAK